MTSNEMNRRSLASHKSSTAAIAAAEKYGNVAFVRPASETHGERYLTCTRSYVSECLNDGQAITVLADHEIDE